jgi:glycosyltransferase involved in cell wall biosynthesis
VSRILLLLPSDPWTRDSGARIRNVGLIRLLQQEHSVDYVIPPSRPRGLAPRLIEMATSQLPDMAQRLWSPDAAQALREGSSYGAVQAEGIEMARYLELVPPEKRVYDAHNAEFLLQQRLADSSSGLRHLYSVLQWRRLRRFEGRVVRTSRLTVAVSEHDANQLLALGGTRANVHVVPNGIDVAEYPFHPPAATTASNVLFLGKLDFRPNAEALAWYASNVHPKLGGTRLFAVGSQPPRWLVARGQHDTRVAVTGYVTDERIYFDRCAALILPVRNAGGSRLKALVAMARGLPIISTRLGMEGLEAEPSVHFLRADTAEEWVEAVQRLLGDCDLRQKLARNARALVEERYDWSALAARVHAAYAWLRP